MRSRDRLVTLLALAATSGQLACSSIPMLRGEGSLEYRQRLQQQQSRAEASVAERSENAPPLTVEERLETGRLAERHGERHRALWNYLEAHRLDPAHVGAAIELGRYYVYDDPERSAAIFASIVARDPQSARGYAGLALARLVQGRLHEARASIDRALEHDPEAPGAAETAAVVYSLLGETERALGYIERAARKSPRDSRTLNNLGVAKMMSGDYVAAESAFRSAILENPEDPVAYNNLGLALGRQGRMDEAAEAFGRFGTRRAVLNNLGYVYYLNGDHERAKSLFLSAVEAAGDGGLETTVRNLRQSVLVEEGQPSGPASQAP